MRKKKEALHYITLMFKEKNIYFLFYKTKQKFGSGGDAQDGCIIRGERGSSRCGNTAGSTPSPARRALCGLWSRLCVSSFELLHPPAFSGLVPWREALQEPAQDHSQASCVPWLIPQQHVKASTPTTYGLPGLFLT